MDITLDTSFLSRPRTTATQMIKAIKQRPHGEYTDFSVETIVNHYFRIGERVRVDPLLALAQVVLETGNLSSWWAARPRRNPAGIGVTGAPGVGLVFASWEHACMAHIGRLLAYALTDDDVRDNAERWALIGLALWVRPLPLRLRGTGATPRALTGRWATDPYYGDKIVRTANTILAA